jgi:hypothetical protein
MRHSLFLPGTQWDWLTEVFFRRGHPSAAFADIVWLLHEPGVLLRLFLMQVFTVQMAEVVLVVGRIAWIHAGAPF